jgi:predicted amidohydrolase
MPVRIVIACGQFSPIQGDVRRNVQTMSIQAREAAHRRARVLVLPELCLSGYPSAESAASLAVSRDGPEIGRVADCARTARVALCFGFVERSPDGTLYNSLGLMSGTGELTAVYRKVHLWDTERSWATPGPGFSCARIDSIVAGLWICYDTRFPEAARSVALAGATLGCVGSAWFGPAGEWELALRARALDNGIYCAGASLLGEAGGQRLHGTSLIVDPHGAVLARAREGVEEVISAGYDSDVVEAFRRRLPLLSDRRPGAYA